MPLGRDEDARQASREASRGGDELRVAKVDHRDARLVGLGDLDAKRAHRGMQLWTTARDRADGHRVERTRGTIRRPDARAEAMAVAAEPRLDAAAGAAEREAANPIDAVGAC